MVLLAAIGLIGLMNYYLYRVAAAAYPGGAVWVGILVGVLFFSVFAAMYFERRGWLRVAQLVGWVGYTWLGVVGIGFFIAAGLAGLRLIIDGISDRMVFHSVFGLTILGTVYGIWEARRVNVRKVEISSQKIGDRKKALRLVQISDLHLGDSSTLRRTRKMVDAINRLEPDLIVSTGDLFDGFLSQMGPYVAVLNELKAPLGKFAVSGNHEVYAGLEEAVELTRQVGFCVLRDEAIEASEGLRVVGVEDPAAPNRKSEAEAMGDGGERVFTLLLKHRPEVDKSSLGKFDLQLSGHTHGGQIFPFHYLTKLRYSVRPGLTDLGDSRFLYLSRGTGTWGPQIRYFAPPEVTYLVVGS